MDRIRMLPGWSHASGWMFGFSSAEAQRLQQYMQRPGAQRCLIIPDFIFHGGECVAATGTELLLRNSCAYL